ncbi:uncharacterized protein NPIL_427641 [Nephila pilipes]|uniref:Uncharacterized protein n=1 Tax=Nephila pilipes TaxID=299642 RepID=A0A8X6U3M9_NEPPI|nr:uncharacterized protein NPIL_427641 [Nephila pilipes]
MCSSDYFDSDTAESAYCINCLQTIKESKKTSGKSSENSGEARMFSCVKHQKEIPNTFENYKRYTCVMCSSDYFDSDTAESAYCINCLQTIKESKKTNGKSSGNSCQSQKFFCIKHHKEFQDAFKNNKCNSCVLCLSEYSDFSTTDSAYCRNCLQEIDCSHGTNGNFDRPQMVPHINFQKGIQNTFKNFKHLKCAICSSDYFISDSTDFTSCKICLPVIQELNNKCVDQPFEDQLCRDVLLFIPEAKLQEREGKTFVRSTSELEKTLENHLAQKLHHWKISYDRVNNETSDICDPTARYLQKCCNPSFVSNYEGHCSENDKLSEKQERSLNQDVTKNQTCSMSKYSSLLTVPMSQLREQISSHEDDSEYSKHDLLFPASNCLLSKREAGFQSLTDDDKKICCYGSPKPGMCDLSSSEIFPQNSPIVSNFRNKCLSTYSGCKGELSSRLMSNYVVNQYTQKIVDQYLQRSFTIAEELQHIETKKIDPDEILKQLKKNKSLMKAVDELTGHKLISSTVWKSSTGGGSAFKPGFFRELPRLLELWLLTWLEVFRSWHRGRGERNEETMSKLYLQWSSGKLYLQRVDGGGFLVLTSS